MVLLSFLILVLTDHTFLVILLRELNPNGSQQSVFHFHPLETAKLKEVTSVIFMI